MACLEVRAQRGLLLTIETEEIEVSVFAPVALSALWYSASRLWYFSISRWYSASAFLYASAEIKWL